MSQLEVYRQQYNLKDCSVPLCTELTCDGSCSSTVPLNVIEDPSLEVSTDYNDSSSFTTSSSYSSICETYSDSSWLEASTTSLSSSDEADILDSPSQQ